MVDHDKTPRSSVSYDRTTETRWGQRNPGGAWLLALLLVPLLLAALASLTGRGGIEGDLRTSSNEALQAAGISGVSVDINGRDAALKVDPGANLSADQLDAALAAVRDVDGVRVASLSGAAAASGSSSDTASPSASDSPSASASPTDGTATSDAGVADCAPASVQAAIDKAIGDDDILFANGKSVLDATAQSEIDAVAKALKSCPDLTVEVVGGSNVNAKPALSQKRADAVVVALAEAGASNNTTAKGVQFESPRASKSANRYADITVK